MSKRIQKKMKIEKVMTKLANWGESKTYFHKLEDIVCRVLEINMDDLKSSSRKRKIVYARHILFFLSVREFEGKCISLADLCMWFNGKTDHTFILWNRDRYLERYGNYEDFTEMSNKVIAKLIEEEILTLTELKNG